MTKFRSNVLTIRLILTGAVLLSGFSLSAADKKDLAPAGKPNVIVIVSDDHGYADLGVAGAKDIKTPNLDSLAQNGIRFTNGYVTCPVCSPTRAGLMTGRYQTRFGHEYNPGPNAAENFGLPTDQKTLANYMKEAGYATGAIGKWHLGNREACRPLQRGFDEYFGFLGGAHSYTPQPNDRPLNAVRRNDEIVSETRYLTYAFNEEARAFVERHTTKPFFLYLAYNAIHTPLQPAPDHIKQFEHITDPNRRTMASMLAALDTGVGSLLETLRKHQLEDNTLIVFIADNGGPTPGNGSRNDPLSGTKGATLEGGIRVPFIVQWKAKLPKGKLYEKPVISLDILPTLVAAAGGVPASGAKLDGVNLLPFLTNEKAAAPHENLFWRFGSQYAVRSGDYKLVKVRNDPPKLFNLVKDIGEKDDLTSKSPELAKTLQATYDAWNKENMAPRWNDSRTANRQARAAAGVQDGRRNQRNQKGMKANQAPDSSSEQDE